MKCEMPTKFKTKGVKLTLNITLFSSSMSGELSLLSDGGLLLDFPDLWLEPLLLFDIPLCAELGRKVNRLGCTPVDTETRAEHKQYTKTCAPSLS
jgi:hypothetical protein